MHTDLVREARQPFASAPVTAPLAAPMRFASATRGPWLRLLSEVMQLAGPGVEFVQHGERAWASATFTGARHTIVLAFEGAQAIAHGETFIAALPDHEFSVPRHLVADAAIVAVEHRQGPPYMTVEVELLVLEDC
ncbi:hypothetical protein [Novosphingobium kaempferiae]|uniref:hypothetical protein n=1 Tax=Novosphingobium kaempferiae TaxID=2896849 RepID=UPI001E60D411|nr:hypothetical protein [Novosphingobium kaempferiae]